MPLHDFICDTCSHEETDAFFSFEDEIKFKCSKCGNLMRNTSFGGIGPLIKSGKTFIGDIWSAHEKLTGMPQPGTPGYAKQSREAIKKDQEKFIEDRFKNTKRKKR